MLPAKNRLSNRNDFQKVYQNGKFFVSGSIAVKFVADFFEKGDVKIGFSVGKNFSKKAVERNRVRRILREMAQSQLESIHSGTAMVIFYRSNEKEPELEKLSKQFAYILRKNSLLAK